MSPAPLPPPRPRDRRRPPPPPPHTENPKPMCRLGKAIGAVILVYIAAAVVGILGGLAL